MLNYSTNVLCCQASNSCKATLPELNEGLRLDAYGVLTSKGAFEVGTKEDILWHEDNRRNYLCATFARDNVKVPIVVYIAIRVLPLINESSFN